MENVTTRLVGMVVYGVGAILWVIIWAAAGGFGASLKNKWQWIPGVLAIVVFAIELASLSAADVIQPFVIEESLLRAIEGNTLQLVMAIFGTLVLAVLLQSSGGKPVLSKDFARFEALALVFIVGGVLLMYWLPPADLGFWVLLRHVKTIPYTYGVCFFLAGLIALVERLGLSWEIEP